MPDTSVVPVFLDGKVLEARQGDSISAAMIAAGIRINRYSAKSQARGMFCGMGVCSDCLVIVDGKPSRRACMTSVRPGMRIQTQDDTDLHKQQPVSRAVASTSSMNPAPAEADQSDAETETQTADLLVIGAGPAGLNAALTAANSGMSVLVIDERDESGGQYYKPRSAGFRSKTGLDSQHRRGLALRDKVAASTVRCAMGETVWFARKHDEGKGFDLRTFSSSGQHRYHARSLVLATGAVEQAAIVPGWTLPGVMTIGAGQTLIRRYGVAAGQRVLVASHGPLGMQLAYELTRHGATVVALLERGRPRWGLDLLRAGWYSPQRLLDAARYRLQLWRRGVPVFYAHEVTSLRGEDSVSDAHALNLTDGRSCSFAVDAVCMGDGFSAQAELARLLGCEMSVDEHDGQVVVPVRARNGSTSVAGLWIAGDAGGLAGADAAQAQGQLVGRAVQQYCGVTGDDGNSQSPLHSGSQRASSQALERALRFQQILWKLYRAAPRALPVGDTILCRCEEVSCDQLEAALKEGARSLAAVKSQIRLGMGRCQGRYCVPLAMRLMAEKGIQTGAEGLFAPQVPVRPIPVSVLQYEKSEWSGHRQSRPSIRPAVIRCKPLSSVRTDVVIIGAGVTGISAALFAARTGASVICLDRGIANGEASGGNAGSLHMQLLSWDFGDKAAGDGSAALATLVLQQESIELWRSLEAQTRSDFEMQTTGGMMVAESVVQTGFLERKVRAENSVGIASEVIDARRMRKIMPAIADCMVAAAWCPGEGKINPLLATPALQRAAKAHGATFEEHAAVTGINRTTSGYAIETSLGVVHGERLIIAAGGWSAQLGAMLGTEIPVRGAPLQMIVTEPAPALVPCLLAHADRHLTMKQTTAGSLIIGGAWTATTSAQGQALVIPESLEGNLWVAARTVPELRDVHVLRSWAAMNIDIDGAPLLGPLPGHPGVVIAATANGYTLGPLMGREAAAMALTNTVPSSLRRFGFDRFA